MLRSSSTTAMVRIRLPLRIRLGSKSYPTVILTNDCGIPTRKGCLDVCVHANQNPGEPRAVTRLRVAILHNARPMTLCKSNTWPYLVVMR